MKSNLFRWQTTVVVWLFLAFFISGCSPQPTATQEAPTQSPVPTARATSSFGLGDIASISRQDAEDLSAQELVTVLVSQWLEGYKNDQSSTDAIVDYQIGEIFIKSPSFTESGMVAAVTFAVQPVGYSDKWGMMVTQIITEGVPWWSLGATFKIVLDGEFFRLRTAFGWGT